MLPITSLQNPHIKLIRSLDDKKYRREHGLFVSEGIAMLERSQSGLETRAVCLNQTESIVERRFTFRRL